MNNLEKTLENRIKSLQAENAYLKRKIKRYEESSNSINETDIETNHTGTSLLKQIHNFNTNESQKLFTSKLIPKEADNREVFNFLKPLLKQEYPYQLSTATYNTSNEYWIIELTKKDQLNTNTYKDDNGLYSFLD